MDQFADELGVFDQQDPDTIHLQCLIAHATCCT
jgi:hypothetical protein